MRVSNCSNCAAIDAAVLVSLRFGQQNECTFGLRRSATGLRAPAVSIVRFSLRAMARFGGGASDLRYALTV